MRHMLRNVVSALDGKPRGGRGQSLLEMTVITPLLILMVLSLIELGFVANNYLTLMDLVRESGRRGAISNPTLWDEHDTRNTERMDCDQDFGAFNLDPANPLATTRPRLEPRGPGAALGYTPWSPPGVVPPIDRAFGYFDSVICVTMTTMAPMEFEDADWGVSGHDTPPRAAFFARNDMVVSALSYARLDYHARSPIPPNDFILNQSRLGTAVPASGVWLTVTGRYPYSNRFCRNGLGEGDSRDPFDFKRSNFYLDWMNGATPDVGELGYGEPSAVAPFVLTDVSQGVRGFVLTGAAVGDDGCIGSRFTVQEVERRLNEDFASPDLARRVADGGLVIVELHWQHHPLFYGPIFQGFTGNVADDPMLYIYGIFSASGARPTATP